MALERPPFETLESQSFPTVRQITVFVDNRPGQLLRLTQLLDGKEIRILALSVVDAADFAVVRLLVDLPDDALELLANAGWSVSVAELVVVRLPHGRHGLLSVWSALLSSEINIAYTYSLLAKPVGAAVALHVDNAEIAVDTLAQRGFEVLGEPDLQDRT